MLRCKQIWNKWEHLRCVVHSTLTLCMTMALINLLGTCVVRIECVWIYFECTKHFSISQQNQLSISSMLINVSGALYFLRRTNKFVFFEVWSRDIYFWRDTKINSICKWTCVLPNMPLRKNVHLSINRNSSFYECKKCKACSHVLNLPSEDQEPTIILFGGDSTHCFARKTSGAYEKERQVRCLRRLLRQSQPSTSAPETNKAKIIAFMA